MAITEDRMTIFTKNTGPYAGLALVFDLVRSINHNYGSTVASHPVEGSGATIADHQYLKNIKIQFSGHISNGVPVPPASSASSDFSNNREATAEIEQLQQSSNDLQEEQSLINSVEPGTPLTAEQAEALTVSSTTGYSFVEGESIDPLTFEEAIPDSLANNETAIEGIGNSIETAGEAEVLFSELIAEPSSDRRIYSKSQDSKQLDALILMENIRDNRLLVDLLTPYRLYTDMTLNFNLPRNMRQGTAFEVNCVLEQQRFVEADIEGVPYKEDSSNDIDSTETQDESPSKYTAREEDVEKLSSWIK